MTKTLKISVTPHNTKNEHKFLLLCLRSVIDPMAAEKASVLAEKVFLDWPQIELAAYHHQVRPILYSFMRKMPSASVPNEAMQRMNQFAKAGVSRNLLLMLKVREVLSLFDKEKIRVVPLKGPLQAVRIYGNLALREIADLDFLIDRGDFAAVKRMLLSNGYIPKKVFTPSEEAAYLKRHTDYEYPFIDPSNTIVLELHWNLIPAHSVFKFSEFNLWERAISADVDGLCVKTLNDEDLLIYMCIHNEKHNWKALKFLLDASLLIKSSRNIDWSRVLKKMIDIDRESSLIFTVFLCHFLFGSSLPFEIQSKLQIEPRVYRTIIARAALAKGRLFRDGFHLPGFKEWRADWGAILKSTNSISNDAEDSASLFLYLKAILTPECIDRTLYPPLPQRYSFVYCIARILRFISFHTNIHLPKKKIKCLAQ